MNGTLNEKDLVVAVQNGDTEAFGEITKMYEKKLYNFSLGMLSNPDDAFDAVQDTFFKAFRSINSFKGESSLYTWLYTICRNCCYDVIKSRARLMRHNISLFEYTDDEEGRIIEIPDTSGDPYDLYQKNAVCEIIYKAIDSLAPHHREIILLRDINELSYDEIAAIMNISTGTVKSRLSRARLRLQKILKDKL